MRLVNSAYDNTSNIIDWVYDLKWSNNSERKMVTKLIWLHYNQNCYANLHLPISKRIFRELEKLSDCPAGEVLINDITPW